MNLKNIGNYHVSSKLHNNILPAGQPQNCFAQQNLVELVSAANVFAQLYQIKTAVRKKETKLTDERDRQLKHASETLLLLTDCDQDFGRGTRLVKWQFIWFMTLFPSVPGTAN